MSDVAMILSVVAKHDLQVRNKHFEWAAAGEVAPEPAADSEAVGRQVGQKTRKPDEQRPNPKRTTREKRSVFRGLLVVFSGVRKP